MRKSLLIIAVAAMAMLTASCNQTYNLTEDNTRLLGVASSAYTLPTVAELQVTSTKISFQMTFNNNLSLKDISGFSDSPKVQYMVKLTLNKAAQKYDADLIVAPNYSIATSEDYRKVTVSITGYPATYTNFRTATNADMELIKGGGNGTEVVPCSASSINDRSWNEFYAR